MGCVNLLLIEPVRLRSSGLRHLLLGSSYTVVEEAQDAAAYLGSASGALPDLVLCGPGTGLDTEAERAWVRRQCTGPQRSRFVALADLADTGLVGRLASLGVDAVLSQDVSGDVLQRSLDLVMLGQQLFPPLLPCLAPDTPPRSEAEPISFPGLAAQGLASASRPREREVVLSQREAQVLRWLVDGASNKVIAREMQITETTVKAHIKGLLRKVRVTNRTQAAVWALGNNMHIVESSGQPMPLTHAGASDRYAS